MYLCMSVCGARLVTSNPQQCPGASVILSPILPPNTHTAPGLQVFYVGAGIQTQAQQAFLPPFLPVLTWVPQKRTLEHGCMFVRRFQEVLRVEGRQRIRKRAGQVRVL